MPGNDCEIIFTTSVKSVEEERRVYMQVMQFVSLKEINNIRVVYQSIWKQKDHPFLSRLIGDEFLYDILLFTATAESNACLLDSDWVSIFRWVNSSSLEKLN